MESLQAQGRHTLPNYQIKITFTTMMSLHIKGTKHDNN